MSSWIRVFLAIVLFGGVIVSPESAQAQPGHPNAALPAQMTAPTAPTATNCVTQSDIPQAECETLVALYTSTDGPGWTDSATNNWNVTQTPCSWTGVTCSGQHVTKIDRSNKGLSGTIPDLSTLTSLDYLNLDTNQLSGTIPDLSALTSLQFLDFSENQLSGTIPSLSTLTSLQSFEFGNNHLSGTIPDLSALTNLLSIHLYNNQLSGTIPDLSALTSLQSIDMFNNQLTGTIPDLSALTNLYHLHLVNNQLTGPIPDLSALTNLKELYLYYNQLSGTIPASVCVADSLNLEYNRFTAEADPCVTAKNADWATTQTVPPTNIHLQANSATQLELSWTPIAYTGDGGYYEAWCRANQTDPYSSFGKTTNKLATGLTLKSLAPDTGYDCYVTTFTPAHSFQQNALTSIASGLVAARTYPSTNPLVATFDALYGSDIITYNVTVTNTGSLTQSVIITGNLPANSEFIATSGSAWQPGGAFNAGFVTLANLELPAGQSVTLFWSVAMQTRFGDIVASTTVRTATLNMEFDTISRIYRVFLQKIMKDGTFAPTAP